MWVSAAAALFSRATRFASGGGEERSSCVPVAEA